MRGKALGDGDGLVEVAEIVVFDTLDGDGGGRGVGGDNAAFCAGDREGCWGGVEDWEESGFGEGGDHHGEEGENLHCGF